MAIIKLDIMKPVSKNNAATHDKAGPKYQRNGKNGLDGAIDVLRAGEVGIDEAIQQKKDSDRSIRSSGGMTGRERAERVVDISLLIVIRNERTSYSSMTFGYISQCTKCAIGDNRPAICE